MNRISKVRRVFQITPFNSLEFEDTILDIPEEKWKDPKFTKALTYIQLCKIQMDFMRYIEMINKMEDEADKFKFIKNIGAENLEQIKQMINNNSINTEGE